MKSIKKKIISFVWKFVPESSFKRLMRSYFYNKKDFAFKSDNVFCEIYAGKTNLWGQQESKSGGGSTMKATAILREKLSHTIEKYSITSMLDVPCGDYNWMKTVVKQCSYIGGDIVPEMIESNQKLYSNDKVQFKIIDITKDLLPKVDLIFCRECLQHLSDDNVKKALQNFKRSGSTYLLVTSFPKTWRNYDIYDGDYRALNLRKKPFCLPKPLLVVKENKVSILGFDKSMYLYKLDSL